MNEQWDFSGWATRNDIKCADGRTIRQNAFADQDGTTVPLVYNHDHEHMDNIVGHALLENRPEGVYAYGKFNDTESGQIAHSLVKNGDIRSLSIWANKLKQDSYRNVEHGVIREVSLVLAGANPGALIDNPVIAHSDSDDPYTEVEDVADIYHGEDGLEILSHADNENEVSQVANQNTQPQQPADQDNERTVGDVIDTLNDEQKKVVSYLLLQAQGKAGNNQQEAPEDEEEEETVKHNVFDNNGNDEESMAQSAFTRDDFNELMHNAFDDARNRKNGNNGSLKEAIIAHADQDYGIQDIDMLFPDARNLTNEPSFIKRETGWVSDIMNGTKHSPFSRIKMTFANITEDEARARGYMKGNRKKEEVFTLLKRTVSPQTIYKKQKLDRDDVIDITDFNVINYVKGEMRIMLDEEIAGAILVGDGRLADDDDKIKEEFIHPIVKEDDLFAYKVKCDDVVDGNSAKAFIKKVIKANKHYRGSGNKTFITKEDVYTELSLIEDGIGHLLYPTDDALCKVLRVRKIITVPDEIFERCKDMGVLGIIVDLSDYTIGADKGGSVSTFEDFDIDYNQMKYLMETRCSGALTKPFSAIVLNTTKDSEFDTKSPIKVDKNGKYIGGSVSTGD